MLDGIDKMQPQRQLLEWSPTSQRIVFGTREFFHSGAINTEPSHDLAHLIIAKNGELCWAPEGFKSDIKLAEYNAVFLEHLLNNAYGAARDGNWDAHQPFERTIKHARWFVERHYAPFPVSAEEAYFLFATKLDPTNTVNNALHFYDLKCAERSDRLYRMKSWCIDLGADRTRARNESENVYLWSVKRQLMRLKGITSGRFSDM